MNDLSAGSELVGELHDALTLLYDPVELNKSRLNQRWRLSQHSRPALELRHMLIEAIESLEPDEDVPHHANLSRYYHVLYQRYVEQFTQLEVAADLGLSVRQLRRLEKAALSLLAEQLTATYGAPAGVAAREIEDGSTGNTQTPSPEEEMRWSQKAAPNEVVDVAEFVEATLETARPLLDSLDASIHRQIRAPLPRLDIQAVSARQALLSALSVAAKHAPRGSLVIEATEQDEHIQIAITVEGPQNSARSWDANDRESLTMAQALAELSGGKLTFDEPQDGRGRLVVRLGLPAETRITVLACDDNPDTLQLLKRYVEGTRYHLVGIQNSGELMAKAENSRPQIIVLDVMMPGIDGWELLGRLQAHPTLGEIPVIVATILPQEQLAAALGTDAFVRKPIRRDAFLSVLDAQLSLLRGEHIRQRLDARQ